MPRQVGERLSCSECGAEVVYTKPCPCQTNDPKQHSEVCCGKEMRSMGVSSNQKIPERVSK